MNVSRQPTLTPLTSAGILHDRSFILCIIACAFHLTRTKKRIGTFQVLYMVNVSIEQQAVARQLHMQGSPDLQGLPQRQLGG